MKKYTAKCEANCLSDMFLGLAAVAITIEHVDSAKESPYGRIMINEIIYEDGYFEVVFESVSDEGAYLFGEYLSNSSSIYVTVRSSILAN